LIDKVLIYNYGMLPVRNVLPLLLSNLFCSHKRLWKYTYIHAYTYIYMYIH